MVKRPEVMVIGRVSVDFYPDRIGAPLSEATSFAPAVGGTSANVAVAAARLGHHAQLVTKIGSDPLGEYVLAALQRHGVDASAVTRHPSLATPVVFAELNPPTAPSIWFYREPSAPDSHLTLDDVDLDLAADVDVLWIPGGTLAFEPSSSTVRSVLASRRRKRHTVLDLDYRPMFWTSAAEAGAAKRSLIEQVTVVVGNVEECLVTVGTSDPHLAADRLLEAGVELAIVKMGADGVMGKSADGTTVVVEPSPVEVVCGLGAGDAFGGSLIHGLLTGAPLRETLTRANAAGAIVAARLSCSDEMPTPAEIDSMLATGIAPPRLHMGRAPDERERTPTTGSGTL